MSIITETSVREAPFAANLYPLGQGRVEGVVSRLLDTGGGMHDYLEAQESQMAINNPHALEYIANLADYVGPEASFFKYGSLVQYESLQDRVGFRQIPRVNTDFITRFHAMHKDHVKRAYGTIIGSEKGIIDEHKIRISLFMLLEPNCLAEFGENLLDPKREDIFNSPVIAGFVQSYFFFREAFSDPSNYSNQTFI